MSGTRLGPCENAGRIRPSPRSGQRIEIDHLRVLIPQRLEVAAYLDLVGLVADDQHGCLVAEGTYVLRPLPRLLVSFGVDGKGARPTHLRSDSNPGKRVHSVIEHVCIQVN